MRLKKKMLFPVTRHQCTRLVKRDLRVILIPPVRWTARSVGARHLVVAVEVGLVAAVPVSVGVNVNVSVNRAPAARVGRAVTPLGWKAQRGAVCDFVWKTPPG